MASVRAHHYAASLLIGAVVMATFAWTGLKIPTAFASCSTGEGIALTAPSAGSVVSGNLTLSASTQATSPQPTSVTFMITAPNQISLGQATLSPITAGTWVLPWNSGTVPNNGYQFAAVAQYGNTATYSCASAAVAANVLNGPAPTSTSAPAASPRLQVAITPTSMQTVPGGTATFTVAGSYLDGTSATPVTPAMGATFAWRTNAGTLTTSTLPQTLLTTTAQPGTYSLSVEVTMKGLTTTVQAPVVVATKPAPTPVQTAPPSKSPSPAPLSPVSSSDPTSFSYNGSTYTLPPAQSQLLQSSPSIFHPVTATNSDPYLPISTLACLEQALGSSYTPISTGVASPTLSQRLAADACFSGSGKIPATLAPIQPLHISQVPTETDIVSIASVGNVTITGASGTKITAILVTGSAAPNSTIFVYVFSDPMVLRAQTNAQGKWTYVLENPLKPGHHEIYGVSQKDASTFVRTPAVPITVAAASSDSTAPSLVIDGPLQPAQVAFGLGSLLMLAVAIILLVQLSRGHHEAAAIRPPPVLIQPAAATSPLVQPQIPPEPRNGSS